MRNCNCRLKLLFSFKFTRCPKCDLDICTLAYNSIVTKYIDNLIYDYGLDYETIKHWALNNEKELIGKLKDRTSYADYIKTDITKLPLNMNPKFYDLFNKYKAILYELKDIKETVINNYITKTGAKT